MDAEIEKQLKELGAQLVSTREELKILQSSPRTDPKVVEGLQAEIVSLKTAWQDALKKLVPPVPPVPPAEPKKALSWLHGFGFFFNE